MKKKVKDRIEYKRKIQKKYEKRRAAILADEADQFALALIHFSIAAKHCKKAGIL